MGTPNSVLLSCWFYLRRLYRHSLLGREQVLPKIFMLPVVVYTLWQTAWRLRQDLDVCGVVHLHGRFNRLLLSRLWRLGIPIRLDRRICVAGYVFSTLPAQVRQVYGARVYWRPLLLQCGKDSGRYMLDHSVDHLRDWSDERHWRSL